MGFPLLGSFATQVKDNLGGRADIDDKIARWLKEAYREIVGGYPLETLENSTEDLTVPGIDVYDYPTMARALKSITLVDPNNTSATPIQPKKRNIQVVRRYQLPPRGTPAVWASFGTHYLLRPTPDKAYTIQLDWWKKCELAADETTYATIIATPVELPDDWFQILVQLATENGHRGLVELDKAEALHTQLFGDPKNKEYPGVIKQRMTRDAAESPISDYGMRPRIRRYCS